MEKNNYENWYLHSKLKDHKKSYPLFLPNFVVDYIHNAFMCAFSTSNYYFFVSLLVFLPGIFSRCFAVPFFTNPNAPTTIGIIDGIATFFPPLSENLHILIVFQIL